MLIITKYKGYETFVKFLVMIQLFILVYIFFVRVEIDRDKQFWNNLHKTIFQSYKKII